MPGEASSSRPDRPDIRLLGFSDRASMGEAWAWLDGRAAAPMAETLLLAEAAGRVLAVPISSIVDLPDADRAAADGYAVHAAWCDGASTYNPLTLARLGPDATRLTPGSACPIASGCPLPEGADAVLPFDAVQQVGTRWLDVLAPVAPGTGISRRTGEVPAGTCLMERGRTLRPQDVAWLAGQGIASVRAARRPLVQIAVPGAKHGPDMLSPLLHALLARDGAIVRSIPVESGSEPNLAAAMSRLEVGETELLLLAGRSGAGPDDNAVAAMQKAGGTWALHGLGLQPGGSAGLGMLGRTPVVLLPGEPFACLVAYDMLAGRLVRRLAGRNGSLPYAVAEVALDRKIVSGIGLLEIVPVRLSGEWAQPVGTESGLTGPVKADGFVVVPEASEGYAAGTRVRVHLYDRLAQGEGQMKP